MFRALILLMAIDVAVVVVGLIAVVPLG
jgi:hypothetical protein